METLIHAMPISEIRAIKKEAAYFVCWNESTQQYEKPASNPRFKLLNQAHAPNKNEAKALRRICAQTGLNQDQVREHKKYRKELALAAGPEFRKTHDAVRNSPYYGLSILAIEKILFAKSKFVKVDSVIFHKLWKEELKRKAEQAILDKLSRSL